MILIWSSILGSNWAGLIQTVMSDLAVDFQYFRPIMIWIYFFPTVQRLACRWQSYRIPAYGINLHYTLLLFQFCGHDVDICFIWVITITMQWITCCRSENHIETGLPMIYWIGFPLFDFFKNWGMKTIADVLKTIFELHFYAQLCIDVHPINVCP